LLAKLESSLKAAAESSAVQEKLKGAATQPTWVSATDVSKMWEERETLIKPVIDELLKQQ